MPSAPIAANHEPREIPWITTSRTSPYFVDQSGAPWTPIGQNDAVTWPDLQGLYRRRDLDAVNTYLATLADHGVTCLRLMLEYSQTRHRYFERHAGVFNKDMVRLWDDLFGLCRHYGLRVLLTPFDTFWMWMKWKHHPYNSANGGPCQGRKRWVVCPDMRNLIKQRLDFATERWGADGTIFAWDLWNEIHPAHAGDTAEPIADFIEDLSTHLRATEQRLHGEAHLQTVSVFTPALTLDPRLSDVIYRHPSLDFVNVHLYEKGTIDDPKNTIDAAVSTGRLMAEALRQTAPERPLFDSEHGPIHRFHDHRVTLPEAFDDEYFRHIQWAHMASGGAGGGMRWPNRHPHSLTLGMRRSQRMLAGFLPLIDWTSFRRANRNNEITVDNRAAEVFGCSDDSQAIVYLLRRDTLVKGGMQNPNAIPAAIEVGVPGLKPGAYRVTPYDPIGRGALDHFAVAHLAASSNLQVQTPPFANEVALAIKRIG